MKKKTFKQKIVLAMAAFLAVTGITAANGTKLVYADALDAATHLIINHVYGDGEKNDAPIGSSFIELYNPAAEEVSLDGYSIDVDNQSDSTIEHTITFTEDQKIGAGKSYLIIGKTDTTADEYLTYDLPTADQTDADVSIDNKKYTITLKQGNETVDEVVGDSKSAEANLQISKQKSLRRINHTDTDDASDWELVSWKTGEMTATEATLEQYAPKNSSGAYGNLHEAQQPVEDPVYTPVTADTAKVSGFNNGNSSLDIEAIARYNSGAFYADGGSLEIVEYNSKTGYAYAVSGLKGKIIAVKISDLTSKESITELSGTEYDVKELVSSNSGFAYGDITSVALSPDGTKLAAAVQHEDYKTAGIVAVFDCEEDGSLKDPQYFTVGVQPDMVTFADNDTILSADEGEPRNGFGDGTEDPKGSVSIISLSQTTSEQVDFSSFQAEDLIAKNILIGKVNGTTLSPEADLEPEYIAVSSDGKTAYVSLQEANAIAALDIAGKQFTGIYSVGFEDYSQVAVDLDSGDSKYEAKTYENIVGARMPDGIALYENAGKTYLLTANEGDSRAWAENTATEYCNEKKDSSIVVSGKKVTCLDADYCAGLPEDKTVLFGGRSFSVFEVTSDGLKEVYDSKDDFERITAGYIPSYFNCSNDDNEIDSRSGKKGPEPENVTIGKGGGRTYAFIAIERIGGIMVYDITEPAKTTFVNYINSREFESEIQGDVSPEGLCFVENQSGNPLLLTACEVSGTLPVYELKASSTQSGEEETKPTPTPTPTPPTTSSGTSSGTSSASSTTTSTTTPTPPTTQTAENGGGDDKKPADSDNAAPKESETKIITNASGKEVEQTVTTTKDKDGNVTGSTVKSVIEKADSNTSVTVETVKDAEGKTISAKAEAEVSGKSSKSGVKGSLSGSVIAQITEAAETKSVTVEVTVSAGDQSYTVKTDASNLTAGTKLRVMAVDSKTGEYVLVNGVNYKVTNSGNIQLTLPAEKNYELLTEKKAQSVEKKILDTVKVKKKAVSLEQTKTTKIQMNSKLNMDNVKKITYTSARESVATVSKSGKITAKQSGTASVKIEVTLKNGKTKVLTVKVKVN